MDESGFLRFGTLEAIEGVRHLVTRRLPQEPLGYSLALHTGEDAALVRANRERLRRHFGASSRFVSVMQVHGDGIHRIDEAWEIGWRSLEDAPRADALLTDRPGVVLTILTADCVPILLADPRRRVVGAVHAGWRGTAAGIVAKTVAAMCEGYGCDPREIYAAIGPSIGGCCYEVGEEVAEAFGGTEGALLRSDGRWHLDLKEANRLQLLASGVTAGRIECSPVCTACERERFFSYRAEEGCSGRFASCIMLEP
ncbi:peptidoglycan editing factor PgeF [Nitratifractor sp.]|uniref:peptidoglycan editing factor PgeF n=1 Tax=Nitratifractor sp. TaxID=2268144 RepID=UPI0025F3B886|nr:peptidoglycan editing factor PgeF [Nitratifractor sp.]